MTMPSNTSSDADESPHEDHKPFSTGHAPAHHQTQFGNHDQRSHGGITVESTIEASVVRLWGEIDAMRREEAGAALATAIDSSMPVVIDTSEVTFIDSSGIAFLVQFCMVGAEEGLDVSVTHPPQVVRDVLTMLGLDGLMNCESSDTPVTSLAG